MREWLVEMMIGLERKEGEAAIMAAIEKKDGTSENKK